jgi:hypothetical protein
MANMTHFFKFIRPYTAFSGNKPQKTGNLFIWDTDEKTPIQWVCFEGI